MTERKKTRPVKIVITIFLILVLLLLGLALTMAWDYKDELTTATSIKEVLGPGDSRALPVYQVDLKGDYYMAAFKERGGVKSTQDLVAFLTNQMSKGFIDDEKVQVQAPACSSFTAETSQGSRIFARNYDMDNPAPLALVHTKPTDGRYESISMVNLEYLGMGQAGMDSFGNKVLAYAGAYLPMDGMNERGLAISIHMSHQGPGFETHPTDQNTGKFSMTSTSMIRYILDHAATVDEAVAIAESIDLHDDIGNSFHYILADASGDTAVLQWINGTDSTDTDGSLRKLHAIKQADPNPYIRSDNYRILTNFITQEGYDDTGIPAGQDRFEILDEALAHTNGLIEDQAQAMDLLESVAVGRHPEKAYGHTLYSVVYNLTDKSLDLVINENYSDPSLSFTYDLASKDLKAKH